MLQVVPHKTIYDENSGDKFYNFTFASNILGEILMLSKPILRPKQNIKLLFPALKFSSMQHFSSFSLSLSLD
jgi:hypothetical protein